MTMTMTNTTSASLITLPDHALQDIATYLVPVGTSWSQIKKHIITLRLLHPRFTWALTSSLLEDVTLDLQPADPTNSQGFLAFRRSISSNDYPTRRLSLVQGPRPPVSRTKKGKEAAMEHVLEQNVATANKHLLQSINACRNGLQQLSVRIDESGSRRLDGFSYLAERGTSFFALPYLHTLRMRADHVNGLLPALCTAAGENLRTLDLDRAALPESPWVSRKYFVESSPFACAKNVSLDTLILHNVAWFADQFNLTRFFLAPKHLVISFDLSPGQNKDDILWGIASLPTCGTTERLESVTVVSDEGVTKKDGEEILKALRAVAVEAGREPLRIDWPKMKNGKSNNNRKRKKATAQKQAAAAAAAATGDGSSANGDSLVGSPVEDIAAGAAAMSLR